MWTQQSYGEQVQAATALLEQECDDVAAYLVTESVPLPPPPTAAGQRTAGLANVALLRRPDDLDEATWLARWHVDHTPVAIETQSTFGYTQNAVVRALTAGRAGHLGDRRGAFPDRGDLRSARVLRRGRRRRSAATGWSGWWPAPPPSAPTQNVDTVPTSRYVYRSPFDEGRQKVTQMTTLEEAVALARDESGLAVVSTLRADGTIQASLVNAGVLSASRQPEVRCWLSSPTAG